VFGGINAWEESDYSVVSTTTPIPKQPGFGAVIAIAGLLVVAYWIKRRKVSL
jgi:PGF-CTERM protein